MINEIVYDSFFLTFEADKEVTTLPITAYSYDGNDYDFFVTSGGETAYVYVN